MLTRVCGCLWLCERLIITTNNSLKIANLLYYGYVVKTKNEYEITKHQYIDNSRHYVIAAGSCQSRQRVYSLCWCLLSVY